MLVGRMNWFIGSVSASIAVRCLTNYYRSSNPFCGWAIECIMPTDSASNTGIGNKKVKPALCMAKTAHCNGLELIYSIIHLTLLCDRFRVYVDGKECCQRRIVHSSETRAPLRIHGSLSRKKIVLACIFA